MPDRARVAATRLGRRVRPGGTRMAPTYLIIGAQKAGTTSLQHQLCQHPRVLAPLTKEVHYFDLHPQRSSAWYRSHFPCARAPANITGEATPYYLFHPAVAARVRRALPDVALIVLLRDPVARAISHHNHELELGYETLALEPALAREDERLAGEEERLRARPDYRSFAHQHHSYVARGRYLRQLQTWWEHFPRERMLILASEEMFADPAATLVRAQEFLGLDAHVPADLGARNARPHDARADVAGDLAARFAPDNERLQDVLGRDLGWA